MKKLKFLYVFLAVIFSVSCSNDDETSNPNPDPDVVTNEDAEIDDFIWKGMNFWYLYKADVPDLANDRFSNDAEYSRFLAGFDTPKDVFDGLRTKQTLEGVDEDRFSFIVEDYKVLEQLLSGVSKSNGMEFSLIAVPSSETDVLGVVRYILPNTDAEAKGIKRGQYFSSVNGVKLQRGQNFNQIFSADSYSLQFVNFDGNAVTGNTGELRLSKSEYMENPVFISKIIEYKGKKIGYLMYNSFTFDYNKELNNVFAQFKDNVDELILDLRNNGGGSVYTATILSSMITGQFEGEVLIQNIYNPDIMEIVNTDPNIDADNFLNSRFSNEDIITALNDDNTVASSEPLNSLNLSKVYILATDASASASELIINGLESHIDVIHIGSATSGKFQASRTLYDSPNLTRENINPNHNYALQPLTDKIANKDGKTDFIRGLIPDVPFEENFSEDLGILGEINEPFLKAALDFIVDGTFPAKRKTSYNYYSLWESKELRADYQRMYIDSFTLPNLN